MLSKVTLQPESDRTIRNRIEQMQRVSAKTYMSWDLHPRPPGSVQASAVHRLRMNAQPRRWVPSRSPSPPWRRRSPPLGTSFSLTDNLRDRLATLSTAAEDPDSAVQERRAKKQPVRKGRRGGMWNSVAEMFGTSTPRPRNGEELQQAARVSTVKRSSSLNASAGATQPNSTPSRSMNAQLARLGVPVRGGSAYPVEDCRSRSSPTVRSLPPRCNDIGGNDVALMKAEPRVLRPPPSRLRPSSTEDGTRVARAADLVSQEVVCDHTPDTVPSMLDHTVAPAVSVFVDCSFRAHSK